MSDEGRETFECSYCEDEQGLNEAVKGQSGKLYCSEGCCVTADDVPDSEDEGDYA